MISVEQCNADTLERELDSFADVLHASVRDGASVNFILPFSVDDALAFWRDKTLPAVRSGERVLFAARAEEKLVGTVHLDVDQPPNQAHRCDVGKLLVHPQARRHGVAHALMQALLDEARDRAKWLVTLDTLSGSDAQRLYERLGFCVAGSIPEFCRDTVEDAYCATTYMYLKLQAPLRG